MMREKKPVRQIHETCKFAYWDRDDCGNCKHPKMPEKPFPRCLQTYTIFKRDERLCPCWEPIPPKE